MRGRDLVRRRYAEAATLLRDGLAILEKKHPDDWSTFHTRSLLGGALVGQTKYAEAEPLLLMGYQGLKQRRDRIPASAKNSLTVALGRLVRLYDAWGKKDEAAKWRKEMEAMKASDQVEKEK